MTDEDNKCAHGQCMCLTTGDAKYCSSYCENAGDQDLTEIACDCGHSECA